MANAAAAEEPRTLTHIVPLCPGIPKERNGTLTLHTIEPYESLRGRLEGVFSVVLYYADTRAKFMKTVYYKGIYHILQILHVYKKRFDRWGLVLYTDKRTRPLLQAVFPFSKFPRLILVEVEWPMYTNSNGNVDGSILRCLRFQVVDLFTDQLCLVRDADTLFPRLLKDTQADDMNITKAIGTWEEHFLNRWQKQIEESPMLVIGTHYLEILQGTYVQNWHRNTPLAFALPFSPDYSVDLKRTSDVSFGGPHSDTTIIGVFAGFVNFRNTAGAFHALWRLCVEYLQDRFFMVRIPKRDPQWGGALVISDYYSERYYGATVGKDEKCILFVMSRYYQDTIYYFDLHYFTENSPETEEHPIYILEKGPGNADYGYKSIPSITFINPEGSKYAYSLLLNPEAIDLVLDQAVIVLNRYSNTPMAYRYHDYFKQNMKAAMAYYEHWLTTINPEEIKAEIGAQLMGIIEKSPNRLQLLEGELENGFLKKAHIYTTPELEKQILQEAVNLKKANKAALERATAEEQAAAEAARAKEAAKTALPAVGGIHGAEVDPATLVNTRRTRRNLRNTRRKNRKTRRR